MNKETLNKLKELCDRGGKATNVDIVDLRELIALAEQGGLPRFIANPDEFQTSILHAMYRCAQRGESVERMHFDVCQIIAASQQEAEPVAWLSAVASCVSSGHATTEAAKHLLMVIESDGLPKFPAIQQPQPAVEREIPVGEKGWRPACCDHTKGAACCDIGYCIADKERAELAQQPQDERAAFEAWAAKEFGAANFVQGNSGGYVNSKLHLRWEAWQARAALAKRGGAA